MITLAAAVSLIALVCPSAPAVAAPPDIPLPGVEWNADTYLRGVYQYMDVDGLKAIPEPKEADLHPIEGKDKYTWGTWQHMFARWKMYNKRGMTWEKFRKIFEKEVFREPGVLSDVREPSDRVLNRIDSPDKYVWGTKKFMFAHWKVQKEGSAVPDWKQWRAGYINAYNSHHKGYGFEPLVKREYIQKEGLERRGAWKYGKKVPRKLMPKLKGLGLHKDDRPLDAADFEKLKIIVEMKSGPDVLTDEGRMQFEDLMKIAKATDCRLITVFGERPNAESVEMIKELAARFGVQSDVRYFPALGQRVTPGATNGTPPPTPGAGGTPPSTQGGGGVPTPQGPPDGPRGGPAGGAAAPDVLAAPGQLPADSPMTEALEGSADSLEDAIRTGLIDDWHAEDLARNGDTPATGRRDLGGVDFSTLELRYVSDTYHNGSGVQYAFKADKLTTDERSFGGRRAARLASDSFFVWLALPPSAFTVNLNPDEPDRIIDAEFGKTDAGRVLLEADLAMKKSVAKFIHPDTAGGRKFWDALQGDASCLSMRQWIVPGKATVRDNGKELYILDAPLRVKMEQDVVKAQGAAKCVQGDDAATRHNEELYRTTILPRVQDAVNHAPEYADLRRVYASRVAAEWFRKRGATKHTAYSDVIGKGDISRWVSPEKWTPREVFDRYVRSYREGEFKVKHTTTEGNTVYTKTYVYGGVDFTRIAQNRLSAAAFAKEHSELAASARNALYAPSGTKREVWLGGLTTSRPLPEAYAEPTPATSKPLFYALAALPLTAWIVAGAVLLRRRRANKPTGA
ncbi:hypothetical protein AB0I82_02860 [Streptomyces sp. NPDC050315]|uniref:hypothetical protein n=1 Tax=Streptomyces sp. NPDC050315 TaxID=3155039 RepID=UPI00344AAE0D